MGQLDDFREQLRLAKGDDAASQEAAASEPAHAPSPQKTVRKKKGQAQREPSIPDRTSISLSRRTFARLDCYNFWLRRNTGRNYPSYSALLDALLDEVLEADERAAAFVERYSEFYQLTSKKPVFAFRWSKISN